jgi:hypothetical protein
MSIYLQNGGCWLMIGTQLQHVSQMQRRLLEMAVRLQDLSQLTKNMQVINFNCIAESND